jgi:hypothetical protein
MGVVLSDSTHVMTHDGNETQAAEIEEKKTLNANPSAVLDLLVPTV